MMDARGVSMPLQYVLLTSIIALLASGLFVAAGGFVQHEQSDAVEHGLEVVGARMATDITAADRLARNLDGSDTVSVTVETPAQVAGSTYVMTVTSSGEEDTYTLTLTSDAAGVVVSVDVYSATPIQESSVAGGAVEIRYVAAEDRLEVRHA